MKKIRFLALMTALLMCVSLALTSCDKLSVKEIEKDPTGQIIESTSSTAEGVVRSASPLDALIAACEKGSVTLAFEDEETGKITLTGYSDRAAEKAALFATVAVGEDTVEAKTWADGDKFVAQIPALSDKTVGLDVKTAAEDLKTSAIFDLLGISYDQLMDTLGENAEQTADLAKFAEDAAKFAEDCVELLKSELNASRIVVEKSDVDLGTDTVKGYTVSYSMGNEDILRIAEKLMRWFADENNRPESVKGLIDFLQNYADEPLEMPDVDAELADMREELEKSPVTAVVKYALNGETAKVMRFDVSVETTGENPGKLTATAILGEDPDTAPQYVIDLNVDAEDSPVSVKITVDRTDDADRFERAVKITEKEGDEEQNVTARFTADRKANTFNFSADFPTVDYGFDDDSFIETEAIGKFTASGDLTYSATEFDMTVRELTYAVDEGGVEVMPVNVRITAKAGEEVPAAPEYKSILKMTSGELQTLGLEITSSLQDENNPVGKLFGAFAGAYDDPEEWDYDDWDDDGDETINWDTFEWDDDETIDWDTFDWDDIDWDTYEYDEDYRDTYDWDEPYEGDDDFDWGGFDWGDFGWDDFGWDEPVDNSEGVI